MKSIENVSRSLSCTALTDYVCLLSGDGEHPRRGVVKGTALRGPLNWVKKPWSPAKAQTENLWIEKILWPSLSRCETRSDRDACEEDFAMGPNVPGELTCGDEHEEGWAGWAGRRSEPDTDEGKARGDEPVLVVFSKMSVCAPSWKLYKSW
jgi:hypothetical protein